MFGNHILLERVKCLAFTGKHCRRLEKRIMNQIPDALEVSFGIIHFSFHCYFAQNPLSHVAAAVPKTPPLFTT